jgi:hypothetical protein
MTTPTAHSDVTQERNTQAPIVARIRALHDRLLRAEILAASGRVHRVDGMPDAFIVEGTKGPYLVKDGKCPCPDAANRNGLTDGHCKHLLAALLYYQEVGAPKTAAVSTPNGGSTDSDLQWKIEELYR